MADTPYGKLSEPDQFACGRCHAEFIDPTSQNYVTGVVTGVSNVGGLVGHTVTVCPKCEHAGPHFILRMGHLEVPAATEHFTGSWNGPTIKADMRTGEVTITQPPEFKKD